MESRLKSLSRLDWIIAGAIAAGALLFYNLTLTPSLSYLSPDGNELATVPYMLSLAHMPGYPLYTWLGKLFTLLPIGDVAHRMNLMSATLGALGAGMLYLIVMRLLPVSIASASSRRAGAALLALGFAFSPTFWSQAVIAEVYAPNIFMIALTLLALLRWEHTRKDSDFGLFALIYGLSLGTHLSNLGFAPAFAIFILITDPTVLKRPSWWLVACLGFGIGLAQFLWLPLKADTLNDRLMARHAPTTLKSIYTYTLGAFSQLKFAFSLAEIPDRIVIYLYLLNQQFGPLSLVLGFAGLVSLLLRRPRHFFLLVGMYLIHVWFFIQYRVFDLDVFFLPAHYLWAVFLGFSVVAILGFLERTITRLSDGVLHRSARWALAGVTLVIAFIPVSKNLHASDHSYDVAINDFYANVWEFLPEDSALLTGSGVFGYDAFYWQLIYGTRADVILPALPTPQPSPDDIAGLEIFSTTPVVGQNQARGPGALPPGLLPEDVWQTPVLVGAQANITGFGGRGRLTLYKVSEEAPNLLVDHAQPPIRVDAELNGLILVGAEIDSGPVESGGRVHVQLYWQVENLTRRIVTTSLGGEEVETHEIGFGNLTRYAHEVEAVRGRVLVEDYWLVVPSTLEAGGHTFSIQIEGAGKPVELSEIEVLNQEETMDRWLRIAG
jgi:hypothetical protein